MLELRNKRLYWECYHDSTLKFIRDEWLDIFWITCLIFVKHISAPRKGSQDSVDLEQVTVNNLNI